MFDPTKEVPSLELCKRLKELGFPQDSGGWYWDWGNKKLVYVQQTEVGYLIYELEEINYYRLTEDDDLFINYIKAPTCRELGELLPVEIKGQYHIYFSRGWNTKGIVYWYEDADEHTLGDFYAWADTEPNARAKMLIWLVENGYVTFQ